MEMKQLSGKKFLIKVAKIKYITSSFKLINKYIISIYKYFCLLRNLKKEKKEKNKLFEEYIIIIRCYNFTTELVTNFVTLLETRQVFAVQHTKKHV